VLTLVTKPASKGKGKPTKRNRTPGPKIYARTGGGFTIRWKYRDANGVSQEIKVKAKGTTRTAAIAEARAIERSILDKMHADPAMRPAAPTVADFVPRFLDYCRSNEKSPATIRNYGQHLRTYVIPVIGGMRLDAVTPSDYEAVKAACSHLSVATRRQVIASMARMMSVAMDLDAARNLPKPVQIKRPALNVKAYSPDEARALITACGEDTRDLAFVLLGVHGGLRRGEVIAVRGEDFEEHPDGRLVLRVQRSVWNTTIKLPKSGRERVVALTREASAALRAHLVTLPDPRGYLFPAGVARLSDRGEPLPVEATAYVRAVQRLCKVAGIAYRATHVLRKTAATAMAKGGASAWQIADMLGHAGIDMTKHYVDRAQAASTKAASLIEGYV
ncbi:MAG TPA: tyrosine-type recombinase/integrase, partial [Nannocystis sp.]